jgi:hypothetical protein
VSAVWTGKAPRLQIVIWAGITALGLFLSLRNYDAYQVGVCADDAVYAVLVRSLVSDRGFGLINMPAVAPPSSPFPLGYPLTLALFVGMKSGNLDILKLPSLLATFANGVLLFWGWHWFSRRSRWWGVAVAGLYVLSPTVVSQSVMVMSEAVFTTLCLLAMLLAEQIARGKPTRWRAVLLGAVLAYVIFTRSIGVVIAPALAAYLLWRKGRAGWQAIGLAGAAGLIFTVFILLLGPFKPANLLPSRYLTEGNNSLYLVARQSGAATGADTQPYLRGSIQEGTRSTLLLVLDRARRHLTMDLRQAVLPGNGQGREQELVRQLRMPWLSMAVVLLTVGLVIVGWLVWWVQDGMTAFGFGAMVYLGASLLWDWAGPRLLYPIVPQLLLCFSIGIEAACRIVSAAAKRRNLTVGVTSGAITAETLTYAFTLGVVVVLGGLSFVVSFRILDSRLHVGDLSARTEWLRANTPASAVVLSEQAASDFLYGDRHTVQLPGSFSSSADLESFLISEGVDYVLVGPVPGWEISYASAYSRSTVQLLPLLAELRATGRLTEVYSSAQDGIAVFKSQSP